MQVTKMVSSVISGNYLIILYYGTYRQTRNSLNQVISWCLGLIRFNSLLNFVQEPCLTANCMKRPEIWGNLHPMKSNMVHESEHTISSYNWLFFRATGNSRSKGWKSSGMAKIPVIKAVCLYAWIYWIHTGVMCVCYTCCMFTANNSKYCYCFFATLKHYCKV